MRVTTLCIAIILSLSVFGDAFARGGGGGYGYGNNSFGYAAIIISAIVAILTWGRHPLISLLIVTTTTAVVIKSIVLIILTALIIILYIGLIRAKNQSKNLIKIPAEDEQSRPSELTQQEHKLQKFQDNFSWRRVSEERFIKINNGGYYESSQKIMIVVQPGYEGILIGSTKWQADEVFVPSHEIQDFWKY